MADQIYIRFQIFGALKEIHKELAWFRAREEAKDKTHRDGLLITRPTLRKRRKSRNKALHRDRHRPQQAVSPHCLR